MWLLIVSAAAAGAVTPPVPIRPERWLRVEDYPLQALANNITGTVHYEFSIGMDGAITGCRTLISSGSALLDEASCAATRSRARFEPARDEAGQPVLSRYRRQIKWTIPDRPFRATDPPVDLTVTVDRLPPGAATEVTLFQLESFGAPGRGCAIHESSGSKQLDRLACGQASANQFKDAQTEADGTSLPVVAFRRIRFELQASTVNPGSGSPPPRTPSPPPGD